MLTSVSNITQDCVKQIPQPYGAQIINQYLNEDFYLRQQFVYELDEVLNSGMSMEDKLMALNVNPDGWRLNRDITGDSHRLSAAGCLKQIISLIKNGESMVTLLETGSLAFPFPDRYFDRIISCLALHNLQNFELIRVIDEFDRCLKNSGKVIIADYMYRVKKEETDNSLEMKMDTVMVNNIDKGQYMKEYPLDIDWLETILAERGLKLRGWQISSFFWIVAAYL